MIQFIRVEKRLNGKTILNRLDLEIRTGETFCIVGPSGTGKSVTLNHVIGLYKADSGRVLVDGCDVAAMDASQLAVMRRGMGMLFQGGALLNWMDLYDNVALPLRECLRLPEDRVHAKVMEILELLELETAAKKMPSEISGGMMKRAGLARALVSEPRIMLYDEPTSGLDPVMSRKIDHLIRALQDRFHMTSVVVTHDLCSAFSIADRIGMLCGGKLIECGTPDEFRRSRHPIVQEFISAQFESGGFNFTPEVAV